MRHIVSIVVVFILGVTTLKGQEILLPDSLAVKPAIILPPTVDSSLIHVSIFNLIREQKNSTDGVVFINQPSYMSDAFYYYLNGNATKKRNGYRIRIFFDNKQSSRYDSDNTAKAFASSFPLLPIYRSYTTPYFKVVVGDYRTKSDAIKALSSIKELYPKAIVIKEQIGYPQF